jgi:hypothetical protein
MGDKRMLRRPTLKRFTPKSIDEKHPYFNVSSIDQIISPFSHLPSY